VSYSVSKLESGDDNTSLLAFFQVRVRVRVRTRVRVRVTPRCSRPSSRTSG